MQLGIQTEPSVWVLPNDIHPFLLAARLWSPSLGQSTLPRRASLKAQACKLACMLLARLVDVSRQYNKNRGYRIEQVSDLDLCRLRRIFRRFLQSSKRLLTWQWQAEASSSLAAQVCPKAQSCGDYQAAIISYTGWYSC